jgi:hypothetical protein
MRVFANPSALAAIAGVLSLSSCLTAPLPPVTPTPLPSPIATAHAALPMPLPTPTATSILTRPSPTFSLVPTATPTSVPSSSSSLSPSAAPSVSTIPTPIATPTPVATPSARPFPLPTGFLVGAYVAKATTGLPTSINALALLVGTLDVETYYTTWTKPFRATGSRIPEVSITEALPADAVIVQRAREMAAYGKPILFRDGWEMNDAAKKLTPAKFIADWRHAYALVHPIAPNALWWFCTTAAKGGDAYYPGDDVVQYAGSDAYARTGGTMAATIARPYAEQAHHKKPFLWGEFGGSNPTVFYDPKACATLRKTYPLLVGMSVFDSSAKLDWRLSAADLVLFKACIATVRGS